LRSERIVDEEPALEGSVIEKRHAREEPVPK
jgi:hypothetical protein